MNNTTKHKQNISFLVKIITTFFLFFGLVGVCAGEEPPSRLEVYFDPDPLFSAINGTENFLPADVAEGTITVVNNTDEAQDVLAEAINAIDDGELGDELVLTISEGENVLYNETHGTFGEFLRAGETPLSVLPAGEQAVYTFEVEFKEGSTGPKGATIGFDICIGFEGVDGVACGDTVISDEDETDPPDEQDDDNIFVSGGSGYIPTPQLAIWGEHVSARGLDVSGNGAVTIEWDTNMLATSKVVYGLSKDDNEVSITYVLNLDDENFGYTFSTKENTPKTKDHMVGIDGLIPNREYKYRVVSRASPATVSYEHTFFIEMEVGELLDGEEEREEGFGEDGSYSNEILPIDMQDEGSADIDSGISGGGESPPSDEEDIFYSAGTEESDRNFLSFLGGTADFFKGILSGGKIAVNTNPNQTGSDIETSDKSSRNLAATLFAFLSGGSGIGKIICILLLLLLLFIIWRAVSKRYKRISGGTGDAVADSMFKE